MRRMNSMLLGHQGASGRTDWVYLRMASWVAGSSHDSGRWTIREATSISSVAGSAPSTSSRSASEPLARQPAVVVVDLQRADARASGRRRPRARRAAERLLQRVDPEAQREIEHRRSVLDQQIGVAVLADHHGRAGRRGRRRSTRQASRASRASRASSAVGGGARTAAESVSIARVLRARPRARLVQGDRHEAHHVARP